MNVLVTGANRGLGLEFVRQFLGRGDRVFAGCRSPESATALQTLAAANPERLLIVPLDVASEASIAAARQTVGEHTDKLDWVLNNAGTFSEGEQGLFHLDGAKMAHTFAVNAIGPALMGKHFAALLQNGTNPLLANLTSGVGLLTDKAGSPGKQYSYAASKAALNLIIRSLSFDFAPLGVCVVGIGPGYVQTDMTKGGTATLLPNESVRGMIATLARLTFADTGRFFSYTNHEDNWMLPG